MLLLYSGAVIATEYCPICCGILLNNVRVLGCGHKFHEHCVSFWLKSCPECELTESSTSSSDETDVDDDDNEESASTSELSGYEADTESELNTPPAKRRKVCASPDD